MIPREFDSVPLKRAALYLDGQPTALLRFRRQELVGKTTLCVDPDFTGDPGAALCHTSELDSVERGRSGVLRCGERRSSWTI